MPGLARVFGAIGLVAAASVAGQTGSSLQVRAVAPPSDDVIRFVARNARSSTLSALDLGGSTLRARDIVMRLCGSMREAYWAELLDANKTNPPALDAPVQDPGAIAWPRCLYVELFQPGQTITVQPNDTASIIYRRLTGSNGSPESIAKFFGASSMEAIKALTVGQKLQPAYRTLPVTLLPRNDDPDAFTKELNRVAAAGGRPSIAMVRVSDPAEGQIVLSLPASIGSDHVAPACARSGDDPLDAHAIARAYRFTYEWIKVAKQGEVPRKARILIVDNGFFGADPQNVKNPFQDSAFPPQFFRPGSDGKSIIAQRINVNTTDYEGDQPVNVHYIDPINYVHGLIVDETSGHGTHVAGGILGGPGFVEARQTLRDKANPWAEISILNVGKGGSGLVAGAHDQIFKALTIADDQAYIVNMSIAYDAEVEGIWEMFDALRRKVGVRGLLVVAAGNNGTNLSSVALLPGSLGGTSAENIVTVAAHDANFRITPFSNFDPDVVDIAAPGCEIASWIGNWQATTPLSGTSMATPLVTFAAGLLRSLVEDAEGRDLKNRLIAASDLLPDADRDKTAYGGIRLSVAKALYWFHDYVRTGDKELLGSVRSLPDSALRCADDSAHKLPELWALKKRPDGTGLLFLGKRNRRVQGVCEAKDLATGDVVFTPTHEIKPDGVVVLDDAAARRLPLQDVRELVLQSGRRPD